MAGRGQLNPYTCEWIRRFFNGYGNLRLGTMDVVLTLLLQRMIDAHTHAGGGNLPHPSQASALLKRICAIFARMGGVGGYSEV